MDKFKKLGLEKTLLSVIEKEKFEAPTKIQEKTIPEVIGGKDVIAASSTGSGKTLAFGLGVIQNTNTGAGVQNLVVTPTRELAIQVAKSLEKFSKAKKLKVTVVYGGVAIDPQIKQLETAEIVVGTPGRLLDHMERGTIELKALRTLILDEADMMLDMGFIDDVSKIINECPKKRQTLLFSATISDEVAELSKRYLKNPVRISVETYVDPKKLKQVFYDIHPDNLKFSLLLKLLREEAAGLVMVFCNTRRTVDFITDNLKAQGIESLAIHGGLTQNRRSHIMDKFHSKKATILVCTDVAARGLDISGVTHVYNYDLPKDSKEYVHRAGRTARAGKEGRVINLVSGRDIDNFRNILSDYEMKISELKLPRLEKVRFVLRDREGKIMGRSQNGTRRPFHRREAPKPPEIKRGRRMTRN